MDFNQFDLVKVYDSFELDFIYEIFMGFDF